MTEPTAAGRLALVEVAQLSETGHVRHHNEDRALAGPLLLAVADGMGGAKAGEVAAQVAVEAVGALEAPFGPEQVREAIERANVEIRRMASEDPDKSGMGTTITAALVEEGERLDVVHVGDSRAYLWRDGELRQLTEDHSVVAELVKRGSISPEEAEAHPHRNVITRALGAEPAVVADTVSEPAREGDVVLLCSDGLSSYVPESEIAAALARSEGLGAAARALVDLANDAGGADNVTVVLARIGPAGDVPVTLETSSIPEPTSDTARARVLKAEGAPSGDGGGPRAAAKPRRRRVRIAVGAVAGLLIVVVGVGGWIASRTYVIEAGPDGRVRIVHGLPFDLLGLDLAREWQDTTISAETLRLDDPGALSGRARGQGEAVALAAELAWRYRLPEETPTIEPPLTPTRTPARG